MIERFGIISPDLWALRGELSTLLEAEPVRVRGPLSRVCGEIVGWSDGRGWAARRLAGLTGRRFTPVRIGPLHSVRPDGDGGPVSLVIGSREPAAEGAGSEDSRAGLALLRRLRLAWRNDGRDCLPPGLAGEPLVLVVAGRDGGTARAGSARLLRRAALDNPGVRLAVVADSREPEGLAASVARGQAGAVPVSGVNPWALFEAASRIYALPGDLARLAILAGRDVVSGSAPTAEPPPADDPAELFRDEYLIQPAYFDAWSRGLTDFATAADQLAWLRDRFLENDRRSVCVGVSRWKARQVARFLDGPGGPAIIIAGSTKTAVARAVAERGQVVAWETRMPGRLEADCAQAGLDLLRMEDGFLRSVGLGAAFLPGASCVLDGRGIYYDPRRESDLEHILAYAEFGPELLARAESLRREIIALRLSKYNVGRSALLDDVPSDRPVVLVPGQVEDDASVLLGSPATPTNLALLEAARRNNPDAFLIFKPHPDVEAGLRRGRLTPEQTAGLADRVIGDVSIIDLLDRANTVETMTSLAGFEALMRGKRTVVHGGPFYAGWGLTTDLHPPPRRTRRLTLDELVAGALILYPRYLDPVTGQRCPPEILVQRLAVARDAAQGTSPNRTAARAAYVRARHALLGPIGLLLRRMKGAVRSSPDAPDRPE